MKRKIVRIGLVVLGVILLTLSVMLTVNAIDKSGVKLGTAQPQTNTGPKRGSPSPAASKPAVVSPPSAAAPAPTAAAPAKTDCSKLPSPQVQANDFEVRDPDTCAALWVGQSASAIASTLGRTYNIKVLPPNSETPISCTRSGPNTSVNGKTSEMLGPCSNTLVYVITQKGITKYTPKTKVSLVWFALAATAAPIRFSTKEGQMCAAGFALARRPGTAPSDLEDVKTLAIPEWTAAEPAWKSAEKGMQLNANGKDIKECGPESPDFVSA